MNEVLTQRGISRSALMLCILTFFLFFSFSSASKWDSGSIGKFDYVEPTSSGNETTITGDCPDGYAVQNITDGGIECIEMTGGTGSVSVNSTQFDSDNPIHIKTSWLTSFIESISKWANYWTKTENINATGYNITADSFIGNGSQLTGLSEKPFAQQGRLSLPQLAAGSHLIEEVPGWAFSGRSSSIQAVSAWLVPIYVSRDVSYRGFRYYIYSTTGKTATAYRLGIYDVDYSTGLPKNLVWDSSKQTFETTTGLKSVIGLNITLTEGWYYIVGTKNGNINLYGSSPSQQKPPIGGFGDPTTRQTLASRTADWTDGFPNPWVNTGFSHMNTYGYEASFFKLYRNSEA